MTAGMSGSNLPLIVGAGPVGLGAALFLARQGVAVRLIDEAEHPSPYSRALAVNPRTLEILKPTGVTNRMLEIGLPIRHARLWRGNKQVAELSFDGLHHEYPFMLALSQAVTERLLTESLATAGGSVERGVRLVTCQDQPDCVEAELQRLPDQASEILRCPWLLGADGAHSTVRREMNVPFTGTSFEKPWHLADLPLTTDLAEDSVHLFLLEDGFLFVMRVVESKTQDAASPLWRVLGNVPHPVARLEPARPAGPPVWTSTFHISHRINARLQQGHVYFAGDAAHIHSPVGARGMNLGLEDAWSFSRLLQGKALQDYGRLRRPVDRNVVRQVELLSRLMRGESVISRLLRRSVLPRVIGFPAVRTRILTTVTGLDHALDGKGDITHSAPLNQ